MSMLSLTGNLINVFQMPQGENKKTGETYGGQDKIQIMAENVLQNGDTRIDLVDLTVEDAKPYASLKGKAVRVPVGVFVAAGAIRYFIPKGEMAEEKHP